MNPDTPCTVCKGDGAVDFKTLKPIHKDSQHFNIMVCRNCHGSGQEPQSETDYGTHIDKGDGATHYKGDDCELKTDTAETYPIVTPTPDTEILDSYQLSRSHLSMDELKDGIDKLVASSKSTPDTSSNTEDLDTLAMEASNFETWEDLRDAIQALIKASYQRGLKEKK